MLKRCKESLQGEKTGKDGNQVIFNSVDSIDDFPPERRGANYFEAKLSRDRLG